MQMLLVCDDLLALVFISADMQQISRNDDESKMPIEVIITKLNAFHIVNKHEFFTV